MSAAELLRGWSDAEVVEAEARLWRANAREWSEYRAAYRAGVGAEVLAMLRATADSGDVAWRGALAEMVRRGLRHPSGRMGSPEGRTLTLAETPLREVTE